MARKFVPPFNARPLTLDRFGLRVVICPACGQIHPLRTGGPGIEPEPAPASCTNCGRPLPAE